MKATWKKIWKPDGTTVELVDGKPKPEFECIMLTPPSRETDDLLTDRNTAEDWIAKRPDLFQWTPTQ